MDFARLDTSVSAAAGIVLHIRHPVTGAPLYDEQDVSDLHPNGTPSTITLLGIDSPEYIKMQQEITNRRLQQVAGGGRKAGKMTVTAEQLEADAVEQYVAIAKEWSGIRLNGQPLPCTEATKRKLFGSTGWRWLREQIDECIVDRSNYLGN
jgi:hypothetical protein